MEKTCDQCSCIIDDEGYARVRDGVTICLGCDDEICDACGQQMAACARDGCRE